MHILEAYYNRATALPSTTQVILSALERGAEVWVTCKRCSGDKKEPSPRKKGKGKAPATCRMCSGKGRFLRRYDAELQIWREGMAEQTRSCRDCMGVVHDPRSHAPVCPTCGGCGYEQALDAMPHSGHEASVYGDNQASDTAVDIGWRLRRLPLWVREVLYAWYRPDAVAYRAKLGEDPGHVQNASLLPLTHLGRLAHYLEVKGDTDRVDAILDAALREADNLRRCAFRVFSDARLVHVVSRGECRGREMQYGRL